MENSNNSNKSWLIFLGSGIFGLVSGIACILAGLSIPEPQSEEFTFPEIPSFKPSTDQTYNKLTGLPISDPNLLAAPAYCVQVPNGVDGARPQTGLDQAGVIFEAIAEAGITRFAAIFQNPKPTIIGPIRSLRLYYLQWDTPFDCTVVHAGGADDAIAALRNGGYKELDENYSYMYRSHGITYQRLWNNLFTNTDSLAEHSSDYQDTTSNITGFTRMTPEQATIATIDSNVAEKLIITKPATKSTNTLTPAATDISINFGGLYDFNVRYHYDESKNAYLRSYASGNAHEIFTCPNGIGNQANPENICTITQLAPSVVVAMMVEEHKAADNYHEDIKAIGSGVAYVFRGGTATKGTWQKNSINDQIKFYNEAGLEISLMPGQTFISAVPNYGSVEY